MIVSPLRVVRWCLSCFRQRSGEGLRRALFVLAVIPVGLAIAGDRATVEAEEYSAYSDPEKPVLSYILSERQNVREFRKEFALTNAEVQRVLAAVREENEALATELAQSEIIVEKNQGLPEKRIAEKITASDYDETVRESLAVTKDAVQEILREGDGPKLQAWVDEQWRQEVEAAPEESSAQAVATRAAATTLVCKVYATQYIGYTRYEAALPHRNLKFGSQPVVAIRRVRDDRVVRPRIKEVGPWNTYDNYWQYGRYRTMWKDLRRCVPEAQAAYYHNYNNGKDEFGREVLNPAGVDLTPAVARRMGLRKYQNAWVYVRFPWVSQ